MQHSEGTFAGVGGAEIYYQCWQPAGEPGALVLIAHGAGEHGGRYNLLAEYLVGEGFAVAALDHFGHGRSDGGRCCLESLDDLAANLETFRVRMENAFPGVPMVVFGHSMGGLVACSHQLQHPGSFVACILSGPAIMSNLEPPWYQMWLIRVLSILAPNLGVLQLDASGVSRLPEEVERYVNDPLVHTGKMSARMIAEIFRVMQVVQTRATEIRLPLLIMHGGADAMAAPEGSEFLYRHAGSARKELKIYPGAFHELINEPERPEVFREIADWVRKAAG